MSRVVLIDRSSCITHQMSTLETGRKRGTLIRRLPFHCAQWRNANHLISSTTSSRPGRRRRHAAATGGGGPGSTTQRRAARSGAVALSELRAVGHHRARAARRPRRPEAGAAPHPLHDVAAEPDRRRQAPQVREGRRRRDGQLPPARRRGALRDAGPHGAVVLAALPAGRRLGQFRIARRRQRRGDALHRMPAHAHQRRDAHRDRADDGALPAELRRHQDRAGRPAGADPEPAGQRRHRHRRRHGDQHPAAQPRRGLHRARQAARQRRAEHRAAVPLRQGARLPDRRPDSQLAGGAQGDLQDRIGIDPPARHLGHRAGDAIDQDDLHRQHARTR